MNKFNRRLKWNLCATVCVMSLVTYGVSDAADPPAATVRSAAIAPATSKQHLQLKLSARELDSVISRQSMTVRGNNLSQLDEVVVASHTELLPMRSPTRDIWGGLAAPFWAMAHPTQTWRIFLPIPPE